MGSLRGASINYDIGENLQGVLNNASESNRVIPNEVDEVPGAVARKMDRYPLTNSTGTAACEEAGAKSDGISRPYDLRKGLLPSQVDIAPLPMAF